MVGCYRSCGTSIVEDLPAGLEAMEWVAGYPMLCTHASPALPAGCCINNIQA